MMLVRQDLHFFINFFHMGAIFYFIPDILMSSTQTDKNNPCFSMNKQTSQFGTFPIQVPFKLPRTVFPHVGVRTDVDPKGPLGHPCLTMIWATCVVEDVSKYLDVLTLEF